MCWMLLKHSTQILKKVDFENSEVQFVWSCRDLGWHGEFWQGMKWWTNDEL